MKTKDTGKLFKGDIVYDTVNCFNIK